MLRRPPTQGIIPYRGSLHATLSMYKRLLSVQGLLIIDLSVLGLLSVKGLHVKRSPLKGASSEQSLPAQRLIYMGPLLCADASLLGLSLRSGASIAWDLPYVPKDVSAWGFQFKAPLFVPFLYVGTKGPLRKRCKWSRLQRDSSLCRGPPTRGASTLRKGPVH